LVELDVTDNKLTDRGIRALASAHFPRLRQLQIGDNESGDEGAKALLESEHLRQLRWLTLDKVSQPLRRQLIGRFPELRVFSSGYDFLSGAKLEAVRANLTARQA
jgi:hypothetical protein